jgi:cystathionine beta-lyase/cystathionine gamma-synthase
LEGGKYGFAFSSGMAAITALFHLLKSGDHVILSQNVYGGTYRVATQLLDRYGLEFEFVDTTDVRVIERAVRPSTKMVFVETPTNPTMEITDIRAAARIARRHRLLSVVDNTFATPYFQQPLRFGVDAVLHSATKYLNGHSDMIGGVIVTSDEVLKDRLRFVQKSVGGVLSPFDSWLCLRGTKTLAVRMERHNENGMQVAKFLSKHPAVKRVNYPGLPSHPQYALAKRQMKGFGAMISFDVGSLTAVKRVLKRVRLCSLAESLGGVETLISHPATMTHASIPKEEREARGITEGLVRISVGIEDVEDIIEDLKRALS